MFINKKNGFTLLELILVILVIGILASLTVPKFVDMQEKAIVTEAVRSIDMIMSAERTYYMAHSRYATDTTGNGSVLDIDFPTSAADGTHWTYSVTANAAGDQYTVTAARTEKRACASPLSPYYDVLPRLGSYVGWRNLTVTCEVDHSTPGSPPTITWGGTHYYSPGYRYTP